MSRWFVVLLAVAFLLHAWSLRWGFFADDYGHRLVLAGEGQEHPHMRPWNLYDFGEVPPPDSELRDVMAIAWWADADWKVRFLRPLSSVVMWADHALFGDRAWLHHLAGLAWFAVLLLLLRRLYLAWGASPAVALGALFFFVADESSSAPVGWVANRNSMIEAICLVAALLAQVRARAGPALPWCLAALGLGVAAALAKESGVSALALLALVPFLPHPGERGERPTWAVPFAIAALGLAALYLAVYVGGGWGTRSLFYPTPWGDPAGWATRVALNFPLLLLTLVLPVSMELAFTVPVTELPLVALGVALAFPMARSVWPRIRNHPAATLGLVLAVVTYLPRAGAPPSDRLAFLPAIGSSICFALVVASAPRPNWARIKSDAAARWSALLIVGAGLMAAGNLFARGPMMELIGREARDSIATADLGAGSPRLTGGRRDAILLHAPNALAGLLSQPTWLGTGGDPDVQLHPLQLGRRGLAIDRTGERTLEIESTDEPFLTGPFEVVYLTQRAALEAGRRWDAGPFTVEALEVTEDRNGIRRVRLELGLPPEDPALVLLAWNGERLAPLEVPPVGGSVEVPALVPPMPLWP